MICVRITLILTIKCTTTNSKHRKHTANVNNVTFCFGNKTLYGMITQADKMTITHINIQAKKMQKSMLKTQIKTKVTNLPVRTAHNMFVRIHSCNICSKQCSHKQCKRWNFWIFILLSYWAGEGGLRPPESGKAISFGQTLNFLDRSHQAEIEKNVFVFIKRKNSIHSIQRCEVPKIWVFY